MCGLSAVFAYQAKAVHSEAIDVLHAQIQSRGPDGEGFFRQTSVCLAHRRLSIIDTSVDANQPFHYMDRYVLIYNGEIFNYIEIRRELESLGCSFTTSSDTEVLIAAFAYWGQSCLHRFNGMWAFILWDRVEQSLFCSRDRFGVKPLYWAERDGQLYFASEPKQLVALGFGSNVDQDELSRYIYAGIVGATSSTFFSGIHSLKPGHNLSASLGESWTIRRWYSFPQCLNHDLSVPDLLRDSVSLRLRSDVSVGSCLSGGIDSSAVVMLASALSSSTQAGSLRCFHARSSDIEVDESSYAQLVAFKSRSDLRTLTPSSDEFWGNIREICRIQDEPFGSPSICMQYFVMQHARRLGCSVMLDGQGADEILLGYSKYMVLAIAHAWKTGGIAGILRTLSNSWAVNASLTPRTTLQYLLASIFSPLRLARVRNRMSFVHLPIDPVRSLYRSVSTSAADSHLTQYLELFHTSLPALLRYEDRNSMAHSVEARVPFLDYRLVEASVALSVDQKIHNGWSKYPLRESGILPDQIAWRRSKLGFNAPERSWIGRYSRQMLSIALDSPLIASISNRSQLERSWPHLDRREQWRIFNAALWAEIYKVCV